MPLIDNKNLQQALTEFKNKYDKRIDDIDLKYDEVSYPLIADSISKENPVGSIINYIGSAVPNHHLPCDGSIINIEDYQYLAEHFLKQYGKYNYYGGDGVTTFAVPNKEIKADVKSKTPIMTGDKIPSPYVVTFSNQYSTGYPAWKAFNGTASSDTDCWQTAAANKGTGWICIDLAQPTTINTIKIRPRNFTDFDITAPKDFTIQGSNDGINFDIIRDFKNVVKWSKSDFNTYVLDSPVTYRYYKLDVTANNGASTTTVGELTFAFSQVYEIPCIKYEPTYTMKVEISNPLTTTDISQESPVGSTISYLGSDVPEHYLPMDGCEYNITDYPYLAEHFLKEAGRYNVYGGDGVTTFALPNKESELEVSYDDITPIMTSNNTPSPYSVTSSSLYSGYYAWKAFTNSNIDSYDCVMFASGATSSWICIDLGSQKKIDAINITSRNYPTAIRPLSNFTLQGSNDGVEFIDIITISGETNWKADETRTYKFKPSLFRYYKLNNITNGSNGYVAISKINFLTNNSFRSIPCIKYEPTYYAVNQYGGFESKVLFEGNASNVSNYNLSGNITDYDFLIVTGDATSSGGIHYYAVSTIIPVTSSTISYSIESKYCLLFPTNVNNGKTSSVRIGFCFTDNSTMNIQFMDFASATYQSVQILQIIGIKGQLPSLLNGGEF